jgi:hypothetical protein
MGLSNRNDVKELLPVRNHPRFDHPLIAVYSQVVCVTFTNLNNSRHNSDTHHDGALPIVKFDKIDLVGPSCAKW